MEDYLVFEVGVREGDESLEDRAFFEALRAQYPGQEIYALGPPQAIRDLGLPCFQDIEGLRHIRGVDFESPTTRFLREYSPSGTLFMIAIPNVFPSSAG